MDLQSTVTLHTGREMPVIGLGSWQLTEHTAATIKEALELGCPMIDTSGDYGTQPGIAEGIKQSGKDRSSFFLVTKVEETDDAYEATKRNLRELQLDYADLMLIHRPPEHGAGEKLWRGLIRAKEEGLTKDIGVSNYTSGLIDTLIEEIGEVPVVNQIEWTPFGYSGQMLSYAREKGMVIQAYSPLTRTQRFDNASLNEVADKYGKEPAQILIRWNLQLGTVPIFKANKSEHLRADLDIFDFEISPKDMELLSSLNEHFSSLGKLAYV